MPGAFAVSEPRGNRHSRRKYPHGFQLTVTLAKGKRARGDRGQSNDRDAEPSLHFRNRYIFACETQAELAGWTAALLDTGTAQSAAVAAAAAMAAAGGAAGRPPALSPPGSARSVEFAPITPREKLPKGTGEWSEDRFRALSERSFSVASEMSFHSAELEVRDSSPGGTGQTEQRQRRVALVAELEAQLAADAVLLSPEASQLIERLKLVCATK